MKPSSLVVGRIRHRRMSPASHAFSVPAFMLRLPMTNAAALRTLKRGWWIRFDERDHGRRDGSSSLQWVRDELSSRGIVADGEIELVCFPRMLGYAFKPVSFWICGDAAGATRAIVAEVRNTFGQTHNYVLCNSDGSPVRSGQTLTAAKAFHVSPFLEVTGRYRFRFDLGPERFAAHIDYEDDRIGDSGRNDRDHEDGDHEGRDHRRRDHQGRDKGRDHDGADHADGTVRTVLATSFAGRNRPLTPASLLRIALRFPIQSFATTLRIHWHALRLLAKRVRWHPLPQ
jgi:DUF1365 family protein